MTTSLRFLSHVHGQRPSVSRARHLTTSSTEGPLYPPLVSSTLSTYFAKEILEKHSGRPALICRKERPGFHGGPHSRNLGRKSHLAWDFEEFDRHINALARGLLNLGVVKGDRVAVIMGNNRYPFSDQYVVLIGFDAWGLASAYACLQWACASIGAILVTINPAYHLNEHVCPQYPRHSNLTLPQVNTLNLVGVRHLFIVPRIRSTSYLSMFSNAFPALRESSQGNIHIPELPQLRNLVVVDDKGELRAELRKLDLHCAIDWREVIVWREDAKEKYLHDKISRSLDQNDIINLQFTRYLPPFRHLMISSRSSFSLRSGTTGSPKAVSVGQKHFTGLGHMYMNFWLTAHSLQPPEQCSFRRPLYAPNTE
jgi:acyl-CoA synthetase (AMP-forming)/AMP-acid ligase II